MFIIQENKKRILHTYIHIHTYINPPPNSGSLQKTGKGEESIRARSSRYYKETVSSGHSWAAAHMNSQR